MIGSIEEFVPLEHLVNHALSFREKYEFGSGVGFANYVKEVKELIDGRTFENIKKLIDMSNADTRPEIRNTDKLWDQFYGIIMEFNGLLQSFYNNVLYQLDKKGQSEPTDRFVNSEGIDEAVFYIETVRYRIATGNVNDTTPIKPEMLLLPLPKK